MSWLQDIFGVLRGAQLVVSAAAKYTETVTRRAWVNSSVKDAVENGTNAISECAGKIRQDPVKELGKVQELLKEAVERPYVVFEGIRQFAQVRGRSFAEQERTGSPSEPPKRRSESQLDAADIDVSSITLKELEELIAKKNKRKKFRLRVDSPGASSPALKTNVEQETATPAKSGRDSSGFSIHTPIEEPRRTQTSDIDLQAQADESNTERTYVENMMRLIAGKPSEKISSQTEEAVSGTTAVPKLSSVAKQRKVPSSRVGRMASFGTLFAGLGIGTVNELTKGALGLGGSRNMKDAFLSPSNAERIVDTLCKVRGAALKLGQILSIQDSTIVSPALVKAFERVRQAADYMPDWQVNRVMTSELGPEWRKYFKEFDEKPFAAASIGQVHRAVLLDDMNVAIKIQYPGVAKGIESDIDNLVGMLKIWDVFPKGFFIDNLVKVAKRELSWEVDYTREAEYTEKFAEMIAAYPEYYVPKVVKHVTTKSVLTTELVPGLPLDKCFNFDYAHRYFIAESVLKLCLRELFQLQCMQTDPNWSNFLYDTNSKRLMLIDFGSTRFYTRDFMKNYKSIIVAAANDDPAAVLNISREMGFLTGYESKQMEEAHVNAVMILGEIFRYDGEYDFGKQSLTKKIAQLVPTMVAHRLCPPPEEIYSIHRKLSGIFLLCSRLNIKMNCRNFYEEIVIRNATV